MEENKMARKKTEKKKCCKLWKFVKTLFILCGLAFGGYVGYKKLSEEIDTTYETETVKALGNLLGNTYSNVKKLESDLYTAKSITSSVELADFYKDFILADMSALRASADEMETMASSEKWPYPSYGDLLFGVR